MKNLLRQLLAVPPTEAAIREHLVAAYESRLGRPLVRGRLSGEEEGAIARAETWLQRSGSTARCGGTRGGQLKLTRRAHVQEWSCRADGEDVHVTARVADGRIEDLAMSGGALDRREAERRIAESLATETRGCA